MIHTVEVYLWGSRIGILHQGENDTVPAFEYDKDFRRSGIELAPFQMPLSDRVYSFPNLRESSAFHGLPGLIADSLPDKFGNAVIEQWLSAQGRTSGSFTALERLCYTGKRGMGALEYVPSEDIGMSDSAIDVTELTEFASEILSGRESKSYNAKDVTRAQMLEIGSSAGGARAKAVIAWNMETNEIRSGQVDVSPDFSHWLIKFDQVRGNGDHGVHDCMQYTLIEYAYYLMARDCGIDISECRIFKKDGMSHFMTKRFDRQNGKKIFMQTLSALGHFDFNEPYLCSYNTYAEYAKRLGIGKSGIEEIYRRMVFNVLAVNCDDHVKNFSFIMDRQGTWKLSPAYDLTFAYNPDNRWLCGHQVTINGKSKNITDGDLLQTGKAMGLSKAFCENTVAKIRAVIQNWLIYAQKCDISEQTTETVAEVLKQGI